MSPTIRATVAQFNTIASQVIASLLCQNIETASLNSTCRPCSPPDQRARIIEKWIRVAQVTTKSCLKKKQINVYLMPNETKSYYELFFFLPIMYRI